MVNDGSTDGRLAIAEELAAEYSWYSMYSTENKGVGHAWDHGAENPHGDYLSFVDSDDEVELDYWESMCEKAMRDRNNVVTDNLSVRQFGGGNIIRRETEHSKHSEQPVLSFRAGAARCGLCVGKGVQICNEKPLRDTAL